jgi:DNA-binding MarR family transcriptional regulator
MSRKRAGIAHTAGGKVFTELVLEVFRLNGRLVFVGDRMTKALGLSTARWQTLGAMAFSEHPLTVAEIARNMGLQRQSVQRTVNMLVAGGMVATHENPNHQRARLVLFTKKGRAAYEEMVTIQVEWANGTAAGFSESELPTVLRSLRSLRARLEATKKEKPLSHVSS